MLCVRGDSMIQVRIEYENVNVYGGFSQYAITVKGESLKAIQRLFIKKIPTACNVYFYEVTE